MKFISKPKKATKFNPMSEAKTVRVLKQVGKSNLQWDEPRRALPPGKRISRTGKIYWETRRNRSDKIGQRV